MRARRVLLRFALVSACCLPVLLLLSRATPVFVPRAACSPVSLPAVPLSCSPAAWQALLAESQSELRAASLVAEQVRSKAAVASARRRAAYPSPLGVAQLRAARAAHEAKAASLAAAARAAFGDAPLPLLAVLPPPTSRAVNVSFVLQYYEKAENISPLVSRLFACTRGALGPPAGSPLPSGLTSELVAHVDSRGDAASWEAAQADTEGGSFLSVIHSNNLHEVAGYNRGAALARGAVLVMLQDDELPPGSDPGCAWLSQILDVFAERPKLGALTFRGGYYWFPEELGKAGEVGRERMRAPDAGPLFSSAPLAGTRNNSSKSHFEFLSTFAYGPVAFVAAAYRSVGGMDEALSPAAGDCGIYADTEMSLRLWANGWQVGHAPPIFERGARTVGEGARVACYVKQARTRHHSLPGFKQLNLPTQANLNYHATVRRFPEAFTRSVRWCTPLSALWGASASLLGTFALHHAIRTFSSGLLTRPWRAVAQVAEHVAALNNNLTRLFEGPAPWEHAPHEGGLGLPPPPH